MLDGFEPTIWPLDVDIPFVSHWSRRECRPRSLISHSFGYSTNVVDFAAQATEHWQSSASDQTDRFPKHRSSIPRSVNVCGAADVVAARCNPTRRQLPMN